MSGVAQASAWMALGTIASRATGFIRLMLLIWAIGTQVDSDLFNTANTLPNSMYILVAGGVFNVVLVPQLVRAMRTHADGGDAYAQRIITLGLLVLAVTTALLVLAVPLLTHLVFDSMLFDPTFVEQRHDAMLLMYLCLPQMFFYGAFVLIGQVLNARERFGPMMWAPIVNNVIACAVLGGYLAVFGASNSGDGFSTGQSLLLGVGSTVGIAAQAAVLFPYLRRAGFRYRPRFDFRGVGLGHTLRLGVWTVLFIVVNQVAFVVINRMATGGNLAGAAEGVTGSGSAAYEVGFLVSQVPHGVITVSLATAILPTLSTAAAEGRLSALRTDLARTVRMALVVLVPIATAVACLGTQAGGAIALGAAADSDAVLGGVISAFALATVTFSTHYLMLRGFYSLEDTRTPFVLQLVVAALNVGFAVALVHGARPDEVALRLALAFGLAYAVGAVLSTLVLSRRIGPVVDREMTVFALRLAASAAVAGAVMALVAALLSQLWPAHPATAFATVVVAGLPGALTFVLAARALKLEELRHLATALRRRRT